MKNLIWCFVCCFTLFNLQGTRSLPLSRTAYIYYHKPSSLSTPFFIFSFSLPAERPLEIRCRFKQACLLYTAEPELSSTFFVPPALPLGPGRNFLCPAQVSLTNILHSEQKVNTFFQNISTLGKFCLSPPALAFRGAFLYNIVASHFRPIC